MTPPQPLSPPSEQPPSPPILADSVRGLLYASKDMASGRSSSFSCISTSLGRSTCFFPVVALLTLTIAVLMQAISNMENDLGYSKRKAETGNRRGLPRATTMGWISNHAAEWAIRMAAVLALINTAALIYFGGWPFALVGVAS